jgi:hypothetical protein
MFERHQGDIVHNKGPIAPEIQTEKIKIPGIETLHDQPAKHVAEVLAMVVRSRAHVMEMKWVLGKYIELTYTTK